MSIQSDEHSGCPSVSRSDESSSQLWDVAQNGTSLHFTTANVEIEINWLSVASDLSEYAEFS